MPRPPLGVSPKTVQHWFEKKNAQDIYNTAVLCAVNLKTFITYFFIGVSIFIQLDLIWSYQKKCPCLILFWTITFESTNRTRHQIFLHTLEWTTHSNDIQFLRKENATQNVKSHESFENSTIKKTSLFREILFVNRIYNRFSTKLI